MSNKQPTKRSGMGGNPLSRGLFVKTEEPSDRPEVRSALARKTTKTTTSRPASTAISPSFLQTIEQGTKESIGVQITVDVNDWLDTVVKTGRRKQGKKIPKQVWIQAGVELLRAMPIDWTDMRDLDELRQTLATLAATVATQRASS